MTLLELIKSSGVSLTHLAKKLEVSTMTIRNWSKKAHKPNQAEICFIAQVINKPIEEVNAAVREG